MHLLLPVMTNAAESLWEIVFGNQMGYLHAEDWINTSCAVVYSWLTPHKNQWESFHPSILKFKTGPAGTGTMQCTGKSQPRQTKPQKKGLLLPVGHYKHCQRQWKYKIQRDCLFPYTHENHSSSISNALGLICQDFHKNEFKTKKTSSIFMIMLVSLWDGRLGCTLCYFPENPSPLF